MLKYIERGNIVAKEYRDAEMPDLGMCECGDTVTQ